MLKRVYAWVYVLGVRKSGVNCKKLLDAVRSSAEMSGMGGEMPTLREYLDAFPRTASDGSEINRRRAFAVFLEFMGAKSDRRLDLVTVADCEGFCKWALERWSRGTVDRHKNCLFLCLYSYSLLGIFIYLPSFF